jgi:4-hydroxybenzoate polyprenyltransferase
MGHIMEEMDPSIPGQAGPADYIFLLRPMILIPVWTFFLLGARHGSKITGCPIGWGPLLAGIGLMTAAIGAAYIINQITDRETDRRSGKLFLISHSVISVRAALTQAAFLAALSLAASFYLMPVRYTILLASGLVLGAAYSIEPVRLKRRAGLDVLANAAGNGIINTLAGWAAIGAPMDGISYLAPYPFAVASVHLSTTLADMEGDSSSGLRTSGVVLGRRTGLAVSTALMFASSAAAVLTGNNAALFASLFSLPFFILLLRGGKRSARGIGVLLPAKAATIIYSLAAALYFPAYIAILAVVIVATRLYYHRRFGIKYPSL